MTCIRLSPELEEKLEQMAKNQHRTKSEIIKRALEDYLDRQERAPTAYDLGKDLFGRYGSGRNDLSREYKKFLRKKISEKHAR